MSETMREENIQRIAQLLAGFKVAMLTTINSQDGSLHSRPMQTQQQHFEGSLWFFSRAGSESVEEIRSGSPVNVAYSLPEQGRYLSFSGMAYVIRDRIRIEMLWNDSYLTWFPLGLKDPDLVLLRVDIVEVEVWDPANQINGVSIKIT